MSEPKWLSDIRASAASAFEGMAVPWSQYTTLKINFAALPQGSNTFLSARVEKVINDTSKIYFVQAGSRVYVNVPEKFRDDVILCDVKKAFREYSDISKDFFMNRAVKHDENKLTAFNFSKFDSGMFLWVNRGADIGVVHFMLDMPEGSTIVGQNIIIAGEGSRFNIVEENFSQPGKDSFHSFVTEIRAGENSVVGYVSSQNFSDNVTSLVSRRAVVEKDAKLDWVISSLGSRLSREVRDTDLVGEGASVGDIEVFFGSGAQHFDITSNINHKVPNTNGNVLVKGVLKDSARSVSQGMIRIDKDAQKTDSFLAEHTLLLDRNARSDAVPGLEIEANDVKATHSASVSQIDGDQVFYLISRGLPAEEAKRLIVLGFLESALGKIDHDVSSQFKHMIEEKWKNE